MHVDEIIAGLPSKDQRAIAKIYEQQIIKSCIYMADMWERCRHKSRKKWKELQQRDREKIIRGWIYRRNISMGKIL